MQIGVCTTLADAAGVGAGGFDYLEASVQELLRGLEPDERWDGLERARQAGIAIPSGNLMVPAALKMTGPQVDLKRLAEYMGRVVRRASMIGMKTIVFGSGGARQVPEGFDHGRAKQQIVEFAKESAAWAQEFGVTIVMEPLCRAESNIINSVAEGMEIVRAVNHPNFQCLVDTYHMWMDDEPLENVREALRAGAIRHVHLADKAGRVGPGESGSSDYRPFFRVLKEANYNGNMSIEGDFPNPKEAGPRVRAFLARQWQEA